MEEWNSDKTNLQLPACSCLGEMVCYRLTGETGGRFKKCCKKYKKGKACKSCPKHR